MRIFISRRKYPHLLDAVRRSGVVAVNFTEPSTNRSLQLKSTSAEVVAPERRELEGVTAYLDLLCADLDRIGQQGVHARTLLQASIDDIAAVLFAPEAAFSQTPGPVAGSRITP